MRMLMLILIRKHVSSTLVDLRSPFQEELFNRRVDLLERKQLRSPTIKVPRGAHAHAHLHEVPRTCISRCTCACTYTPLSSLPQACKCSKKSTHNIT